MYMPDEFDFLQDDVDDLVDLEHETEAELQLEYEQAAANSAFVDEMFDNEASQKEDEAPKLSDESAGLSQNANNPSDVITPNAKRQKIDDSTKISTSPRKSFALEDVSNFENFRSGRTSFSQSGEVPSQIRIPLMGERKFYKRIPEGSDYLPITNLDGQRFYVRVKSDSDLDDRCDIKDTTRYSRSSTGLCGVPYSDLLEQATLENSRLFQVEMDQDPESGYESSSHESSDDGENLWVEKFRPKSYLQLLSDDGTNRMLLRWLKLWDKLVFSIDQKPTKKMPKNEPETGDKKKPFVPANSEIIEELDEGGRPKQRVALLHGPPGLGKTTLAHVVAKHAGYNVVEMNASDDRSMEAFKIKLEAATQMRSVSEVDKRPNCLIIDEIDGAPSQTIQFLVGLITGSATSKGKKKTSLGPIQRPIICICNELYTPSLRNLRQHALIIQFPPTLSQRLAQRLLEIASRENLRTDLSALLALCEKTGDDIRACLSTLQFFKSRGKRLQLSDVHKTQVGQKDVQKSHFYVWDEIFKIPRTSKRKIDGQEVNAASTKARFRSVLSSVQASGDYDRLHQGVFENYLSIKFRDSRMENVELGQQWFCFFDLINQQIMSTQNYSLMSYLSYTFVMSHFLFSSMQRSRISYPSTMMDKRNALQRSQNILDTLVAEMSATARAFNPTSVLVKDTLPYLLTIMQPNLRPVNTQLYSPREKKELQNLVNLLIAFNLNYVQERSLDGSYVYRLDPAIEEVIYFPEMKHPTLPYAIKQIVAHEVELEAMRRREGPAENIPPEKLQLDELPRKNAPSTLAPEEKMRKKEELTKKLQAKDIQVTDRVAVDFFGRPIQKPSGSGDQTSNIQAESDGILSSDVWFKFKEGYNNAVRIKVRVKDLF